MSLDANNPQILDIFVPSSMIFEFVFRETPVYDPERAVTIIIVFTIVVIFLSLALSPIPLVHGAINHN